MENGKGAGAQIRYGGRGNHDKRFITQVLEEVQLGKPRSVVCQEYGIYPATLRNWLRNNKLGLDSIKTKAVTSKQTKRSIVRAIKSGQMTMYQVQETYGIKSATTVRNWVRQFEQENDELGAVKDNLGMKKKKPAQTALTPEQAELKALKKSLADAELKVAALNTLIDVAEEQLNINIRKKPGAKQSND